MFEKNIRFYMTAIALLLTDFIIFCISILAAFFIRIYFFDTLGLMPKFDKNLSDILAILWMFPVIVAVFLYEGLYAKREPLWDEVGRVLKSLFVAFAIIFSISVFTKSATELSRSLLVITIIIATVFFPIFRRISKKVMSKVGIYRKNVLFIGDDADFDRISHSLLKEANMGLSIVSSLNYHDTRVLKKIVKTKKIDSVIVVSGGYDKATEEITNRCYRFGLDVIVVAPFSDIPMKNVEMHYIFSGKMLLIATKNTLQDKSMRFMKRAFDVFLSVLLLPVLFFLIATISVFVSIESRGPIFYRQKRVGQHNRSFKIIKFRTMYKDADQRLVEILNSCPNSMLEWQSSYKLKNDPRITRIGSFLRRTSLDELPQIFNVLMGDMSLVGPRPVVKKELRDYYKEYAKYYVMIKPGITGIWQVEGRSDTSYDFRVKIDTWYILNWSLWQDIVILLKTINTVLRLRGAY